MHKRAFLLADAPPRLRRLADRLGDLQDARHPGLDVCVQLQVVALGGVEHRPRLAVHVDLVAAVVLEAVARLVLADDRHASLVHVARLVALQPHPVVALLALEPREHRQLVLHLVGDRVEAVRPLVLGDLRSTCALLELVLAHVHIRALRADLRRQPRRRGTQVAARGAPGAAW